MGRRDKWMVLLLLATVACGRGHKSGRVTEADGGAPADGGERATAGAAAAGDTSGSGGVPQDAIGGAGGEGPTDSGSVAGEAGAPVVAGGAAGANAGGVAGADTAGAAGAPAVDECADSPEVVLEAPLATTTLTSVAPLSVSLGQGFSGDEPGDGELLSEGCVTGQETNSSALLHVSGTEVLGGGTPSLGILRSQPPAPASFLSPEQLAPFVAALAIDSSRALYGSAHASISIWPYFLLHERRSSASPCGKTFVRAARLRRAMAASFKVVFASTDERELFVRCFSSSKADLLSLDDPSPVSRYLIAHGATVSIHVLRAAGQLEATQQILDATQCSAANLPACASTLEALQQQIDDLLLAPPDTLPLAQLTPGWGMFDFTLAPYSVLPD